MNRNRGRSTIGVTVCQSSEVFVIDKHQLAMSAGVRVNSYNSQGGASSHFTPSFPISNGRISLISFSCPPVGAFESINVLKSTVSGRTFDS
jgi:hypothetical protein